MPAHRLAWYTWGGRPMTHHNSPSYALRRGRIRASWKRMWSCRRWDNDPQGAYMMGTGLVMRSPRARSMTACGMMGTIASHAWRSLHLYVRQPPSLFHGLHRVLYSGSAHGSAGVCIALVVKRLMRAAQHISASHSPPWGITVAASTIWTSRTLISPLCALIALAMPSLFPPSGIARIMGLRFCAVVSAGLCSGSGMMGTIVTGRFGGLRKSRGSPVVGPTPYNGSGGTTGRLPLGDS